jgi:hypothetical protein
MAVIAYNLWSRNLKLYTLMFFNILGDPQSNGFPGGTFPEFTYTSRLDNVTSLYRFLWQDTEKISWLACQFKFHCMSVSDLFSSILIFSLYEWKLYAKYFASCWPKQDDGISELIWFFLELHFWKLSWTIANYSKPWI